MQARRRVRHSLIPRHVFRRILKIIKSGTTDECVSDMQCHLRLQKPLAVIITHCYFVFSMEQHFCLWSVLLVPFIRLYFRERKPHKGQYLDKYSPNKTAPLKFATELWRELCQILTNFKNSFTSGKRINFQQNM